MTQCRVVFQSSRYANHMGHGASSANKCKQKTPGVDYPVQPNYPVQPPVQPPVHPPAYNEPLHVPVSFYPDNVYSTSTGNGVVAQINRDLDNFDYALTEALDGNRYFNRVHDPTIPPAPGMVQQQPIDKQNMVCITANPLPMQPSTSSYVPAASYVPPAYPSNPPPSYPGNPEVLQNPQANVLPEKSPLSEK